MKGFKNMCRYTKSGFSKSSSTPQIGTSSERVFSATHRSENQQLPPAHEDSDDEDLVSPIIYPRYSRNAFEKKTEEEDADGSESEKDQEEEEADGSDLDKGQEEEAETSDIPTDYGNYSNYGQGWNQHSGPFRRSPIHLPIHPSLSYGNDGCALCSHNDCPGCKSFTGGSGICPGCGRNYPG